jgi:hypothetical protein
VAFGIVLAILYNKFVIKNYSEKRKLLSVFTFVFFITFSISIFVVNSVRNYFNKSIITFTVKMDNYINENYSDNVFVRNGIRLEINSNDIDQINTVIVQFKSILPTYNDIGVSKRIYDFIVDNAINEMQDRLIIEIQRLQNIVNTYTKRINTFIDTDNTITISSITNGIKSTAINKVDDVAIRIGIILFIPTLIYIIFTLIFAIRIKIKNRESKTST